MASLYQPDPYGRGNQNYRPARLVEGFNLDNTELARLRARRRGLPWRHIYLFVLAVVFFKIFLYYEMGPGAYGAKIELLSQGNLMERVAGVVMVLDPVSQWVVDEVRSPLF